MCKQKLLKLFNSVLEYLNSSLIQLYYFLLIRVRIKLFTNFLIDSSFIKSSS